MAFGFKLKQFKTQNEYTIEELYEAIKDRQFTAGTPSLTQNGLTQIITFPPLDKNNQIWVLPGQIKRPPYSKWTVQKSQIAGLGNQVLSSAIDDLTGNLTMLSGVFGKNARTIEKLVTATCEELANLGL